MSERSQSTTSLPTQEHNPKLKKRSPNWLPTEEEQLAISWLHVSQDPESSNNQTGNQFYAKVCEHFNTMSKLHYCDADQIRIRWLAMNTATLKFSAIYNRICMSPPSGSSPIDWMKMTRELYQANNKGQAFKLEKAWEVVRDSPKWVQEGVNARKDPGSLLSLQQSSSHSTPSRDFSSS
ncbi:hypothetical protein O181_070823, partial [Austropuccinia psidii MF-1]|nr:hypothetical protein [Austropuccinia psidii MF-1]